MSDESIVEVEYLNGLSGPGAMHIKINDRVTPVIATRAGEAYLTLRQVTGYEGQLPSVWVHKKALGWRATGYHIVLPDAFYATRDDAVAAGRLQLQAWAAALSLGASPFLMKLRALR